MPGIYSSAINYVSDDTSDLNLSLCSRNLKNEEKKNHKMKMVLFVLNEQIINRRAAIKEWPMVMYWSMYHGYILQSALISNLIWDVGNGDVYSWSSLEEKL